MFRFGMTHPGRVHAFEGTACQDAVASRMERGIGAIALCDGAGSLAHAAEGGRAMADSISRKLIERFGEYLRMQARDIAEEVAGCIRETVDGLAARHSAERDGFGSTLLAVCCEAASGRYVALHLGDGVIAARSEDGSVRTLSFPDSGREAHSTYLTTSSDAQIRSHLRVIKGDSRDRAFFMTSDGAERILYAEGGRILSPAIGDLCAELTLHPARLKGELEECVRFQLKPMDDFSVAILVNMEPSASLFARDAGHGNLRARRVARGYLRYVRGREMGMGRTQAARYAGWRKKHAKRRIAKARALCLD